MNIRIRLFLALGFFCICAKSQIYPNLICDQSTLTVNHVFYPNTITNYTVMGMSMRCFYLCGPNTTVYDTSFTWYSCRVVLINSGCHFITDSPSCQYYDAIYVKNNGTLTINASANGGGFKIMYEPTATVNDLTGFATTYTCSSLIFPTINCNDVGLRNVNQSEAKIAVYPNPVTSILNISSNLDEINTKLFDVTGKEMKISMFIEDSKNQIDLNPLKKGIYILEVYSNNFIIERRKIIKE